MGDVCMYVCMYVCYDKKSVPGHTDKSVCIYVSIQDVCTCVAYTYTIATMHVTITYKTGCVYGGNLTAILLPDEVIVSVPSKKVYREYR